MDPRFWRSDARPAGAFFAERRDALARIPIVSPTRGPYTRRALNVFGSAWDSDAAAGVEAGDEANASTS
jgi:hypothetical protein